MKEYLGETKNDYEVWVDLQNSHAATHFADTPQLLDLVKEIIPTIEPRERYTRFETNMGRIVGTSDLVETEDEDEIAYAKRPNRDTYSRFVKNKKPQPTSTITIELRKVDNKMYDLYTAYIGPITPPFPGSEFETPESKPYWSQHALAWGTQEVLPETETKECPW